MHDLVHTQTVLVRLPDGEVPDKLVGLIEKFASSEMQVNFSRENDSLTVHLETFEPAPLVAALKTAGFEHRVARVPRSPATLLGHPASVEEAMSRLSGKGIPSALSRSDRGEFALSEEEIADYIRKARTDPCIQVRSGRVSDTVEITESISWDFTPDEDTEFENGRAALLADLREEAAEEIEEAEEELDACPGHCPNESVFKISRPPSITVVGPAKRVWFFGYYWWWRVTASIDWVVIKVCR